MQSKQEKKIDESRLQKTVESFVASFSKQQRTSQETFTKTLREMNESSSEEIAGVRAGQKVSWKIRGGNSIPLAELPCLHPP
jgi:hypothetical protein